MKAERIKKGFRRLALLLAAIPLLIGAYASITGVHWTAPLPGFSPQWSIVPSTGPWTKYQKDTSEKSDRPDGPASTTIEIKGIGTVDVPADFQKMPSDKQQAMVGEIVAAFWRTYFAVPLAKTLAITLAVSLAVYAVVRAIGWVIGGFAAS